MSEIVIIEDTPDIAEGLRENLEAEGYSVELAASGEEGLMRLHLHPPSLLILDLMLPGMSGFHVLRRLRDEGFDMPVLILSARASEAEKVRGFRIGADDYVTKPFGLREVLARVDALMRRRRREVSGVHRASRPPVLFGDIELRLDSREVLKSGKMVELRPREFDLLAALALRPGVVIARRELLDVVWGYEDDVLTRTVDAHLVELRRKLEDDPRHPRHILTVRKAGYMLRLTAAS
jgi:DNA-binding response OmpR family regulator